MIFDLIICLRLVIKRIDFIWDVSPIMDSVVLVLRVVIALTLISEWWRFEISIVLFFGIVHAIWLLIRLSNLILLIVILLMLHRLSIVYRIIQIGIIQKTCCFLWTHWILMLLIVVNIVDWLNVMGNWLVYLLETLWLMLVARVHML